uniref:Leucine rich repeat protein n=1 Tax=Pithovirus LCPAC001 TaxID=2506585 RepID=A0A481Z2J8_9VIRU|nr:MAG: hypothetical protein LCPAC001_00410 [Pithovirus LCPAC001]
MYLDKLIEEWLEDTTLKLDISDLRLTEWPKQLVGKEHLIKKLNCSYNELKSLPNNLHEVPGDFVPWTNLKKLDCSHNRLASLPNNLTKLKTLDCWNNKLKSLPNGLTNLETLYCFDNKLTSLPNNLTKLKILSCSYNELTYLPNNLTKLETLKCYYNELTSLPNNLTNLEQLYCFNNELTSLPHSLTKLKILKCFDNKLFSNELEKWKKIWPISIRHQRILRTAGIKKVVKVLKNRLYLPSLDQLREELIWSPNHPGKFFKSLPRVGLW